MERRLVATDQAPAAIGPYNQAIVANGLVFTAGQIPLVPGEGKLVEGGIADQTERVLENLKAILVSAGSSMDRVVKTTVYIKSMDDFPVVNEVYGRFFSGEPPARSTVEVAELPMGAAVEIDAIALA